MRILILLLAMMGQQGTPYVKPFLCDGGRSWCTCYNDKQEPSCRVHPVTVGMFGGADNPIGSRPECHTFKNPASVICESCQGEEGDGMKVHCPVPAHPDRKPPQCSTITTWPGKRGETNCPDRKKAAKPILYGDPPYPIYDIAGEKCLANCPKEQAPQQGEFTNLQLNDPHQENMLWLGKWVEQNCRIVFQGMLTKATDSGLEIRCDKGNESRK